MSAEDSVYDVVADHDLQSLMERIVVDADDYNEAVGYASDYFIDKWGLKDSDRYERLRSIPWCKTHRLPLDFLRDDGERGWCDAGGSLECEVGVVWEVINE